MSDSKLRGNKIQRVLVWSLFSYPDHEVAVSCTEELFLVFTGIEETHADSSGWALTRTLFLPVMHWGKSHFKKSGISKLNPLYNVQWNCKAEPVSFLVFSDLSCWAAAFWVPLERCQPAELSRSRDSIYQGWSFKPRHVTFAQVISGELYINTASLFSLTTGKCCKLWVSGCTDCPTLLVFPRVWLICLEEMRMIQVTSKS